jgi:hypothetical protein
MAGLHSSIHDFFKKVILGMGLGAAADGAVEFFRVPVLNDSGTFGNSTNSNFTIAGYTLSIAGTTAGIADIAVSHGVLTFTKEAFPIFLGFGLGIYFYEHTFRNLLGIQKINPYTYAGGLIPPVLPSGTNLPFITSNPLSGIGLGGMVNAPTVPVAPALPTTATPMGGPTSASGATISSPIIVSGGV